MATLRVYLSARFGRRLEMQSIATWLRFLGYDVCSRWIDCEEDDRLDSPAQVEWAANNTEDVRGCDVLVAFAENRGVPGAERGGRHSELGMAIVLGKPVILVGEPEQSFHVHPIVTRVPGTTAMALVLRGIADAMKNHS